MHWEDFYSSPLSSSLDEPSTFARFCLQHLDTSTNQPATLWEIGCGTGRDFLLFNEYNIQYVGVDASLAAIDYCKRRYPGICAIHADALQLPQPAEKISAVYARFFLHAIDGARASAFMEWSFANLCDGGRLFIECRSTLDPMFGLGEQLSRNEFVNGHYRRFIDLQELVAELEGIGFNIEYLEESPSLSPFPGDDPVLIRIIAKNLAQLSIPSPNIPFIRMRDGILDTLKLLRDNQVPFFAHCGTILGAVRCNGITPWDTDFDLGIFEDQLPILQKALSGKGYGVSSSKRNLSLDSTNISRDFDLANELIWIYKEGAYIQVNVVRQVTEYDCEFWHDYAGQPFVTHVSDELRLGYQGGKYNIPACLFFPLSAVSFYEESIQIPAQAGAILQKWYGENCLTHYPRRYSLENGGSLDTARFLTDNLRIDIPYRA